jgi:hypothetical protein
VTRLRASDYLLSFFLSYCDICLLTVCVQDYCYTWSHSTTHTNTQSVELLWTSDQPDAESSLPDNKHSQQTPIHGPDGIRTDTPSKQAAVDPRLRTRGHWDRNLSTIVRDEDCFRSARSALGPTQPPIKSVAGGGEGIPRGKAEDKHSPPSSAEVKNERSYTSTPSFGFRGENINFTHQTAVWLDIARSRHGGKTQDVTGARNRYPSHWVHSTEGSRLFAVRRDSRGGQYEDFGILAYDAV